METKEKNLEQDIESWLLNEGGYVKGTMAWLRSGIGR